MDSYKYYNDQLDKELAKVPQLVKLEKMTNVPKVYLVASATLTILLLLSLNYAAALISSLIGFIYPAYASFLALESHGTKDAQQWLTYWIIFAMFTILEYFTTHIMTWFPFYYLFKSIALLYLFLPQTRGAEFVYTKFIRGWHLQTDLHIKENMDKLKKEFQQATSNADLNQLKGAVKNAASGVANH